MSSEEPLQFEISSLTLLVCTIEKQSFIFQFTFSSLNSIVSSLIHYTYTNTNYFLFSKKENDKFTCLGMMGSNPGEVEKPWCANCSCNLLIFSLILSSPIWTLTGSRDLVCYVLSLFMTTSQLEIWSQISHIHATS